MPNSARNSRRGVSLVQLMVVAAILATILAAVGSSMTNMFKASKTIDMRSQAQSFENLLNLNLGNSASCRSAFGIARDAAGKVVDADQTNTDQKWRVMPAASLPSVTNSVLPEVTVAVLQLSGSRFATDGTANLGGDLKLDSLVIKFKAKPLADTPDIYPASLVATLTKKDKSSLGGDRIIRSVELSLQMQDHGGVSTTKQIADCYSVLGGQNTPEKSCEDMGGRWLRATMAGSYMPKERCTMAAELTLGFKEGPDGIPFDGETSATGERTDACLYQTAGQTTVKSYACPGVSGMTRGRRCAWNRSAKEWWLVNYSKGVQASTPVVRCTKGVKISLRDSGSTSVYWDTPISGTTSSPFPTAANADWFLDQSDRLEAAIRCYPYVDRSTPLDCKNNFADALGPMGGSGACLYVRGVRLYGTSQLELNKFTDDGETPLSVTNYTGWIWVSRARNYTSYAATNPDRLMLEAYGRACYQVDVTMDEDGFSRPAMGSPVNDNPVTLQASNNVIGDPTVISQCYYQAKAAEKVVSPFTSATSADAIRSTLFTCSNTFDGLNPPSGADVAYKEWTGETGSNPTMNKGTCWYVKNAIVGSYYKGKSPSTSVTAPVTVPTSGADNAKYTGWVWLTADLPDGKFRIDTSDMSLTPIAATTSIGAVPCNRGIRLKTSP